MIFKAMVIVLFVLAGMFAVVVYDWLNQEPEIEDYGNWGKPQSVVCPLEIEGRVFTQYNLYEKQFLLNCLGGN